MSRVSAVVLVLITFSFLPGCFVGEFVSSYFNTYYNAQRLFGEAEDEIWNLPETKQTGRDYLIPFNPSVTTKTKFTSVIEKCSKLLQYHPESGLVDDALLMIGKSYFYQGENQKAERKFRELIQTYPGSSLVLETELMMAYTYFRMPNRDSASVYAKIVVDVAGKRGDDSYVARASKVLGQIESENKNYGPAREYFERVAELGDNADLRTAAYISVAQMDSVMGDFVKAEAAYRRARQVSNNYLGEYRGQIGAARMLARQGKYDDALAALSTLRANTNYKEFFGEIDLETANTLRDKGEIRAAIAQYTYVDTVYARTETSANSYYQLGLLYETKAFLYDSARAAYNKGKTESTGSKVTPLISRRSDLMNKYALYRNEIAKNDSIRAVLLLQRDSVVSKPGASAGDSSKRNLAVSRDTVRPAVAVSDSSKISQTVPHDTSKHAVVIPDSLNTSQAVAPDTANSAGVKPDVRKITQTALPDTAKTKLPAQPPVPIDTIYSRLAFYLNEMGGLFYTGLELPDSARPYYNALLKTCPNSPLVPRALYSLAQISGQDSTIAPALVDSMYREIIRRYPQSEFAGEAQRLLGLPVTKKETDIAGEKYRVAELLMLAGHDTAAIDTFKFIAQQFPLSPLAPKALYAAGWLYDQSADRRDSAIAVYERLAAKYPYTQFAVNVGQKLAEVVMKKRADAQAAAKDSAAKAAPKDTTAKAGAKDSAVKAGAKDTTAKATAIDTTAKVINREVPPVQRNPPKVLDEDIRRQPPSLPKPLSPANDSTALKERLKRE